MPVSFKESDVSPLQTVTQEIRNDDVGKKDLLLKVGDLEIRTERFAGTDDTRFRGLAKCKQLTLPRISIPKGLHGNEDLELDFDIVGGRYSAFRQFGRVLGGVPTPYMLKCSPGLALDNLMYWQQVHGNDDILVRYRTKGTGPHGEKIKRPYIRAVLAATYGKLDNAEVWEAVRHEASSRDMSLWKQRITDYGMYSRLLLPGQTNIGTQAAPEWVSVGINLGNSETGHRNFTVDIMLFELICSNGTVYLREKNRLVSQKHVAINKERLKVSIGEGLEKVTLWGGEAIEKFKAARELPVEDPQSDIRVLWKQMNLPSTSLIPVLETYENHYSDMKNRQGVIRALTDASQAFGDPDLSLKIDEAAGMYMQRGLHAIETSESQI